jgi:hypothetical protein
MSCPLFGKKDGSKARIQAATHQNYLEKSLSVDTEVIVLSMPQKRPPVNFRDEQSGAIMRLLHNFAQ